VKYGWELPRRLEKIRQLRDEPTTATYPVPFRGKVENLPIRTVSIETPKYRLNNGRTEAAQLEYLAKHPELPQDFFSRDHESDEAQKAQHEILTTMVNDQNLLEFFRDNLQEIPLILTDKGFVLNGNRRLCAFRMLFAEDAKKYAGFANIAVVVLPSSDEKDLDRLESRLQREPDIRAPYPWFADAVKYRRRLEEFGLKEVAAMEDVEPNHITTYITMLDLAEKYLAYRGVPYQYGLLTQGAGGGEGRFAFEALVKHRGKFKQADAQEAFTLVSFAEMAAPKGRAYDTIPKLAEHFEYVEKELPRTEISKGNGAAAGHKVEELFGKPAAGELAPIIEFAKKFENAAAVRDVARDIVAERELIKRDLKKQNFVYEQVRKATTFLKEAYNGITAGTSKSGVEEQLREATEYVEKLKAWLKGKQ
jgi:hypothetical protein